MVAKVGADKLIFTNPRAAMFTGKTKFLFKLHHCLNLKSFAFKGQEKVPLDKKADLAKIRKEKNEQRKS